MKKFISVALSLALCLSLFTNALAVQTNPSIDDDPIQIWSALRNDHYLTTGDDGLLYVDDNNTFVNMVSYPEFLTLIEMCNDSIRDGILIADHDTAMLKSVIQFETDVIPYGLQVHQELDELVPYNAAHGCSVESLALLQMCQSNYNTLVNYYNKMLEIDEINPDVDPTGATIAYWIALVRPGGEWDYKVHPNFGPYSKQYCSYFNGNFNHITAEYVGNFNYGYTGSFLFSLNTLHLGSSAVSGFSPKDREDWPAIDAGFQNASGR